ncbi:MAG: hypothetical protein ABR555_05485 [Pyrinomonadaceae bacterium]
MKFQIVHRRLVIVVLQVGLLMVLIGAGWLIYRRIPPAMSADGAYGSAATNVELVMHQPGDLNVQGLDVTVELYPVDIIAVRHEFFSEPRPGKRIEDFERERMRGRTPVSTRLDKQGRGSVQLTPGNWWLHARLSGDEEIEWRLPVSINGSRQLIELTTVNAYTRSKTF